MRAVLAVPFALLMIGTSSSAAHAAGSDPASAEALFREGREALKRGNLEDACARFAESQRLDPAPGTLLNLAECEEKRGKIASAWAHLREALDGLAPNDDRAPAAAERAAAIEPRLPRLVVRLASSAPANVRVERDGVVVGPASLGIPLPIDPGEHRVTVQAEGRALRTYGVVAAEARRVELTVDVGEPQVSLAGGDTRGARPGSNRTAGYVLLGGAGVATVVGAITGVLAIQKNAIMSEHCDTARQCDDDGFDASRSGRTFDIVSTVSFVAAGVLLAGGVTWLFTHKAEPTSRP